ncbi:MAG: 30S ribosomal protein S20 [Candidatus Omnitrophota bacterium]
MPQRYSSVKELRKSHKRHMHNLDIKTDLKKTIKAYMSKVNQKNKEEAQTSLKLVYKKLDKASKRGIVQKNTAARRKSRFTKLLTSIAS